MKRNLLIMFTFACMAFLSCSKEKDDLQRTPIFKVVGPGGAEPSKGIEISGRAQESSFKVLATGAWTAEITGSDAFLLSPAIGAAGSTTVNVSVSDNNSGEPRSATVTFYFNEEARYTYVITQVEMEPFLDITPKFFTLTGEANEFTLSISTNQASWAYEVISNTGNWITEKAKEANHVTLVAAENKTNKNRNTDIKIYSVLNPAVFTYVTVQQSFITDAPKADLLDVVFAPDGSARDISGMGMNVNLRASQNVSTTYLDKYGRYAAVFSRSGGPYANQTNGYYTIPYTDNQVFKSKLDDGFTIEMLVRRYDDPVTSQVKPFGSTQAGGAGICFRANATNEFNFEVHTGGAWRNCYSGVTPRKDIYYHAIATWDKANGVAKLYVDGVLTSTTATVGDFKHMTTNVNAYWFGIGADPTTTDLGEATFHGEVAIARLYDNPLTTEQVQSLWKLVK